MLIGADVHRIQEYRSECNKLQTRENINLSANHWDRKSRLAGV